MEKNGGGKSHATVPLMPELQAVIGGTLQNIPRQYVPQARRPEYKTSQDITSQLLNVPITKRASYNITKASEHPDYKIFQTQNALTKMFQL
jgi:hypothetical protein